MNINYDKELNKILSSLPATPPKLLLHACCAPCSTYCLTQLITHFDVTLYYANNNITDCNEWNKRLVELQKLVEIVNNGTFEVAPIRQLKLAVPDFDNTKFFAVAKGLEQEKEGGARCKECFVMRLTESQRYAVANGFDFFGTTLTVSPYKNSQLLNAIGINLASDDVKWLPSDFKKRNGYAESVRLSQKYDLYRQHYCGCCYSLPKLQPETV